jgi:hypothetical protein
MSHSECFERFVIVMRDLERANSTGAAPPSIDDGDQADEMKTSCLSLMQVGSIVFCHEHS